MKRLSFFERYLSAWVALCIVAGVATGKVAPGLVGALSRLEVSHVNLPIAVLIWLMIYPMMLRIDFTALRGVGQRPKGLLPASSVLSWRTSMWQELSSWRRRPARRWCSSGAT